MKIGVVIPIYKQWQHLRRCLDSVLWQLQEDELPIVVYEEEERREAEKTIDALRRREHPLEFRYLALSGMRRGISAARNAGARLFCENWDCDWIKFLDADDVMAPFALSSFRQFTLPPETMVVAGGLYKVLHQTGHPHAALVSGGMFQFNWGVMESRNPALVSGCFVRHEAFMGAGGFDEKIGFEEDWDFWLRLRREFPGKMTFATVPHFPVAYYWISEHERADKVRDHSVEYNGERIDVREYFRRHYQINPQ